MIIGSGKQWLKQLRTDVQAIVLELVEPKLVLGDPRLAGLIERISLVHIKSTSDLFLACAELAQNRHLVVVTNNQNGGGPKTYTVFDAELLSALTRKQLVNPGPPLLSVPASIQAPPDLISVSSEPDQVDPVPVQADEEVGELAVIDEQWVSFLCGHVGKEFWNSDLLVWLCTKGSSFSTVDLRLVITGKKSVVGVAMNKQSASNYVRRMQQDGQVITKKCSGSRSSGANVKWVAEVNPAVHELLSRLLDEYHTFQIKHLDKKCLAKKKKRRKKQK